MLSFLKAVSDKLPKRRLKFLKYIPDRVLFGKAYFQWNQKVSFDKSIVDKNLFEILVYVRDVFTSEMKDRLHGFNVKSKIVKEDAIVKTHRGKVRFLVQNIKDEKNSK